MTALYAGGISSIFLASSDELGYTASDGWCVYAAPGRAEYPLLLGRYDSSGRGGDVVEPCSSRPG